MKFFHVYDSESFEGLVKNNFINEDTGFKIQHVFAMPGKIKFNEVAAKGTFLYNMIKEGNHPFYVDRLTGGLKYHPYAFDKALIREYREILGQWFLGFQLHELAGNRRNDWDRIEARTGKDGYAGDVEAIEKALLHPESAAPDGFPVYRLTQGSPAEYAGKKIPLYSVEEYRRDLEWIISKRQEETDGMIVSCDSGCQLTWLENRLGVKTFLPEVGCQIPGMRIEVALARGMAKAYHKKWGTYYECWKRADNKYTQPVYNNHPFNEWHFRQSQFADDFTTGGQNGGSSRLLQRRIYYYSLMSGAELFGEEWGLNCSYTDMHSFDLSPYGLLKKQFIEFARGHKRVKAKVPFAIVLPLDYDSVSQGSCCSPSDYDTPVTSYMSAHPTPAQGARIGKIQNVLKFIYRRDLNAVYGNEGHTMQNSRFGDLFDILYADAPVEAFEKYDLLIDADPDRVFELKMKDRFPVISGNDREKMEQVIRAKEKELLPITVDSLHWLLSEDENGRYLTVFNNEGNTRTVANGDEVDHAADATTLIHTKKGVELKVLYASSDAVKLNRVADGEYSLFVPATDLVIFQY